MYNWSTDLSKIKTKEKRVIFQLEQMINFGLNGGKINEKKLKKYWFKLRLDPERKKFMEFILWDKTKY